MTLAVELTLRHGIAFHLDRRALWRPRALRRHFGVASSIERHRPAFACWTLLSLGVEPAWQHRGLGIRLLELIRRT